MKETFGMARRRWRQRKQSMSRGGRYLRVDSGGIIGGISMTEMKERTQNKEGAGIHGGTRVPLENSKIKRRVKGGGVEFAPPLLFLWIV